MKLKLTLCALAVALSACGNALPAPETVRAVSLTADQICAALPLLPASDEKANLAALCAGHASARELAEAYAQCPGAK